MFTRLLRLPKNRSFFLFGARNTGKSTLIEHQFPREEYCWVDLLDPGVAARFAKQPNELVHIADQLSADVTHIIIDEIQKAPQLLDVVHLLMKHKNRHFIMTGSSARKLKHGGANLLAGRAFVCDLYPLSFRELGKDFELDQALAWGTLPELFQMRDDEERADFLNAYAHTYLKEEVWGEHFIHRLDPFRQFLEVAAQMNGKIINYAKIARDVGVDDKTVKSYFGLLEDTLIGFFLPPYSQSLRKRLQGKPKFYFFDPGVVRALSNTLDIPLRPQTHAYGNAFEHYIITECIRLSSYLKKRYTFSYVRTVNDVEADLVITRPGKTTVFVEIKSTEQVTEQTIAAFSKLTYGIENSEAICLSKDPFAKKINHVVVMPWQQGLDYIFE